MPDKIKHRRSSLTGAAPVAGVADDYGILSGNLADKKLFMADAAGVSVLMSQRLEEYSAVRKYAVGDLCIQADSIYRCIVAVDPVGAFDALKWEVLGPAVLPVVGFKATRATPWAIAPATWYPAQPDQEVYDNGGYYDPVTFRWTPPAGDIAIGFYGDMTGNIVANRTYFAAIYKNGAILAGDRRHCVLTTGMGVAVHTEDKANGTDYYEAYINADQAGSGNKTLGAGVAATAFYGHVIAEGASGAVEVVVTAPGKGDVIRHDGTKFVNQKTPYPILTGRVAGKPAAGAVMLDINVDAEVAFIDGLPDTLITGLTAATAIADFKLWRGGNATDPLVDGATLIGTIRVAAASLVGAGVAGGGNFTLTPGQRLRLTAPAAQDATLADVSASIHGYRQ